MLKYVGVTALPAPRPRHGLPSAHLSRSCTRCSALGLTPSRPKAHSSEDMSLACKGGVQGVAVCLQPQTAWTLCNAVQKLIRY